MGNVGVYQNPGVAPPAKILRAPLSVTAMVDGQSPAVVHRDPIMPGSSRIASCRVHLGSL